MKTFILTLLLITPCLATNPDALDIADFKGTHLIVGAGKLTKYKGQRQTSNTTEYSIDIDRRVQPSLVSDGLNPITYINFPDDRFECICFEHVSFCPYERPDMFTPSGGYKTISTGVYEPQAWLDSVINARLGLPMQLLRILKPLGTLTFRSPILPDKDKLSEMYLDRDENSLQSGLQAWKTVFESAGFQEINFQSVQHDFLKGCYVEMTAMKPQAIKRHKSEAITLERQYTKELPRTWSVN